MNEHTYAECWVCGEPIFNWYDDFEKDGYHSPCVRQAKRIEEGLRHKPPAPVDIGTVQW